VDALVLVEQGYWPEFLAAGAGYGFLPRRDDALCEWKSNMVPVVAIQNGPTCFNATLTG